MLFLKKLVFFLLMTLLILPSFPKDSFADSLGCGYVPVKGTNPTFQQTNCLLTKIAIENHVPPEIAKAVASTENGSWKQFDDTTGMPIISKDGGIGIMQITLYDQNNEDRIKNDAIFNIEEGIKKLANNFYVRTDLPTFNDQSPTILENWYFAVMAYNGTKPVNSPFLKCAGDVGSRNKEAYQEKVFANLELVQEMPTEIDNLPLSSADFQYECGSSNNIKFNQLHYVVNAPLTESRQLYGVNDYAVTTQSTNVREKATTGLTGVIESKQIQLLNPHTLVKISGIMTYDLIGDRRNQFVWYPIENNLKRDKTLGYVTSKYLERVGSRYAGSGRYATAAKISQNLWDKADTVVLARGDDFPDALAGAPLAHHLNAPILLTESNRLSTDTKEEILRLGAKKVVILGGTKAVSTNVFNVLHDQLGLEVNRIAGSGRYATSVEIAKHLGGNPAKAILAFGGNFPDALAIAPYAAQNGYPILLTEKETIPSVVKTALNGINETIIVGGTAVVSKKVETQLPGFRRIEGSNRYETAANIIKDLNLPTHDVFFATGNGFADALTGSVLAAQKGAPLLLVEPDTLPSATMKLLNDRDIHYFYILGGNTAVNETVVQPIVDQIKQ